MKSRLILGLALIASACGHADPKARYAEAQRAFAAEDYAGARTAVLAALEAAREDSAMLLLLARADLALGDGDGAGAALARLAPGAIAAQDLAEMRAEAALLAGRRAEALDLLQGDQGPVASRIRAEAALAQGDSAGALAAFLQGMAAGGGDARLAAGYARFLLDEDDNDGAAAALDQLRAVAPNRLDTALIGATVAQRRGEVDRAEAILTDAVKRFPGRAEPLVALADLADAKGQQDRTAELAQKAVALAPADPAVVALKVRVMAEKGDWPGVRDALAAREATLDCRSFEGLAYGEAMLRLGHAEAARAIFAKALLLSPQNPYARLMLAQSDLNLADGRAALTAIRPLADSVLAGTRELEVAIRAAGLARDPVLASYEARIKSPELTAIGARAAEALAAQQRRDWKGAIAAYRAIPGYDHDAEVLKRMAQAASNMGDAVQAIGYADRALELDPRNPDMLHVAGVVRLNAGRDPALAQSLLHQALERDPANRRFRADYARAGG